MAVPLRILIVEDSEDDALLTVRELRRANYDIAFERVDTAAAMSLALARDSWDLIIADYTMPQFSGLAALEVLKGTGLDIPFIILSGSIGEELAVEAMKGGAQDYVMKGNVQRLVPSIERELREAQVRREHQRAEVKIKRNTERIQTLHEINLAITSILDLREILNILLEKIDFILPHSATTIRLFNNATGELEPVACRNINEREWKSMSRKGMRGLARIVLENKMPLAVANVQTDPRNAATDFARKEGLVSYVGVPLIAKGTVLGLIAFYTKTGHSFDDPEIEFLCTLAGQGAIAIYNARLFEQINLSSEKLESTNQRLEKSLKELSGLYAALSPLTPAESASEMLDGIVDRLIEATGADAALIRLRKGESKEFHWAGQRGFPAVYLRGIETAPVGGAIDWILRTREPIIAPDITSEPRLRRKVQLRVGFRSCAILPLQVDDEPSGLIHLASKQVDYFNNEQKGHLMAIARQMSIALKNRELYENLKASKEKLEKADKIKSEFLGVMSHELRTPLNIIMGFTSLMKDQALGDLTPEQANALDKVALQSGILLTMIDSIMDATKIESGAVILDNEPVDVASLLGEIKDSYRLWLDKKEVELIWKYALDLPVITTDKAKLRTILKNLINNAVKFTDSGKVTVLAEVIGRNNGSLQTKSQATKCLQLIVEDTGIGIAKENLASIFEMFYQVDGSNTRAFGGVGLGLYIVKQSADLLGLGLEVESEPGKGSRFALQIPLSQSQPIRNCTFSPTRAG